MRLKVKYTSYFSYNSQAEFCLAKKITIDFGITVPSTPECTIIVNRGGGGLALTNSTQEKNRNSGFICYLLRIASITLFATHFYHLLIVSIFVMLTFCMANFVMD